MEGESCSPFCLEDWSTAELVSRWLNIPTLLNVSVKPLGSQFSGSSINEMELAWEDEDGKERHGKYVVKIGVHDAGLGRYRESAFYQEFGLLSNHSTKRYGESSLYQELRLFSNDWKKPESNTNRLPLTSACTSLHDLQPLLAKCYFTCFERSSSENGEKDRSVVVLEYIDGVDSGLFFGCWSPLTWKYGSDEKIYPLLCRWIGREGDVATKAKQAEKDVCIAAAITAARLHGPFWGQVSKILQDPRFAHAACRDWYEHILLDGPGCEVAKSWTAAYQCAYEPWLKEKERVAEINARMRCERNSDIGSEEEVRPYNYSRRVVQLIDAAFEKTTWGAYVEHLERNPSTFVHGDFHPGNFCVAAPHWMSAGSRESSEQAMSDRDVSLVECMRLIDFEMFRVGSGPQEIGQYMISHLRPSHRREYESEVLRTYQTELSRLGVTVDEDYIKKEYIQGGAGRWCWFAAILPLCDADARVGKYFHDQMLAFFEDHGVTEENAPLIRV